MQAEKSDMAANWSAIVWLSDRPSRSRNSPGSYVLQFIFIPPGAIFFKALERIERKSYLAAVYLRIIVEKLHFPAEVQADPEPRAVLLAVVEGPRGEKAGNIAKPLLVIKFLDFPQYFDL